VIAFVALIAATFAQASIQPLTLLNDGTDTITPATLPPFVFTSDDNSSPSLATVAGWVMLPSVDELYKQNSGGAEEKTFASSYSASITPAADYEDILFEYDAGATFGDPNLFALIKDGNQEPAIYVFNISNWDRVSDLRFLDFWRSPVQGSISHFSIYGGDDPPGGGLGGVPEPVSILVWFGLAFACAHAAVRCR
jgi:hypothetical protein